MNNLSPSSISRRREYKLPAIEIEITDGNNRRQLPRHMLTWETKSHRSKGNFNQIDYIPRTCKLKLDREQKANVAFNILKYQLSDRQTQQKHLENVRCNLHRRLQTAKNQGNKKLLNILQEEYRQLEISN